MAFQPYHGIMWFRCNHGLVSFTVETTMPPSFFLCATAALREVWVHGPFLICSSFLAGVVQMSR